MRQLALATLLWMTASPGWSAEILRDQYPLRAGDVIAITVWNHPELSMPEVQIRPDGKVMHPYAGEIVAAGKTPETLAKEIRKALLVELLNPIVSVNIAGYKQDWLFVTGAVRSPGPFPLREPMTIREAIMFAGGPAPDADLSHVLVIAPQRRQQDIVELSPDLSPVGRSGRLLLDAGYTLVVRQRDPQMVAGLGALGRAGIIDIPEQGLRISDLIALMGGLASGADARAAHLTRPGEETITVDLQRIIDDVNDPGNIRLEHGDVLFVPPFTGTIAVLGQVLAPGIKQMPIERPLRVSDAVVLAGGLAREADGTAVTLMRPDGTNVLVDVQRILETRSPQEDLELASNDTLIVPELPTCILLGAVNKPGRYPLKRGTLFSSLLAEAGGVPDAIRRSGALFTLLRQDGSRTEGDLTPFLSQRYPEADFAVQEGDVIIATEKAIAVAVFGAVANPGQYPVPGGSRFSDVLAVAGYMTPDADTQTARIVHGDGSSISLNPADAIARRDADADPVLQNGDTVIIDRAMIQVTVLGKFAQTGPLQVRRPAKFSDVIARAGGIQPDARLRTATVVRNGETFEVDLDRVLNRAEEAANVRMQDGDTVVLQAGPPQEITVMGRVGVQQKIIIKDGDRVSDAIVKVGGLAPEADTRVATIMRADGTVVEVDLEGILVRRDPDANLPLLAGDTLVVGPLVTSLAGVTGAVKSVGFFPIEPGETLSKLLIKAGGVLDSNVADGAHAVLRRADGSTVSVDVTKAQGLLDATAGTEIRDGDTLYVPFLRQATIVGPVRTPGRQTLVPEQRVSGLVMQAGGLIPEIGVGDTTIMHRDGTSTALRIADALGQPGSPEDPPVEDGDILFIGTVDPVTVSGAVRHPGVVSLPRGSRAPAILGRVGGPLPSANLSESTIYHRDGTITAVDLTGALSGGQGAEVEFRPGDVLIVPETNYQVSVLGAVTAPGTYPILPGARLSDVLALAKDVPEGEVIKSGTILRGTQQIPVQIDQVLQNRGSELDPLLQDNDIISIQRVKPPTVSMLGEIRGVGRRQLEAGTTLSEAIAAAGGLTPNADPARVNIVRDGLAQTVDLSPLLLRGEVIDNDPELEDGDLIVAPESTHRVTVLGFVKATGTYYFKPGETVLDGVLKAGGWVEKQSAANRTILVRRDGDVVTWGQVDLLATAKRGDPESNPPLEDDDILYVPEVSQMTLEGFVRTLFPVSTILRMFD